MRLQSKQTTTESYATFTCHLTKSIKLCSLSQFEIGFLLSAATKAF